jgi:(p)ppGpp synthase/HD superfamily hydrolase
MSLHIARAIALVTLDAEGFAHAGRVAKQGQDEEEMMVGWLHDVLEDNRHLTWMHLRDAGFDSTITEAVKALTRPEVYHDYMDYIRNQVARNDLAKRVKLYDLLDNLTRSAEKPHLKSRYLEAQRLLSWGSD